MSIPIRPIRRNPNYKFGQECEHGHLARKCDTCELMYAELYIQDLEQYAGELEGLLYRKEGSDE